MGRVYSGGTELGNRKVRAYTGISLVIDFELDRAGFRKIAVSDEVRNATTRVVRERALPFAIAISPYDEKSKGPHYRNSFVIRQGFETVAGLRRVATRLFNISDHAVEVEWLNESHVLGKTLGHLLQESVIEELLKQHTRRFKPDQHPRGEKGRFVPKRTTFYKPKPFTPLLPDTGEETLGQRDKRLTAANDPEHMARKAAHRAWIARPF